MRLLNSSTFQLQDFTPDQIPVYAILSHTWGREEVLFVDFGNDNSIEHKTGYKKIKYACAQAAKSGLGYVGIDTCCIDKRSSAELSEVINSMFKWYQRAEICYAYLADVPADVDATMTSSAFANSRWFTRGWTLQELLAAAELVFFSADWIPLGTKSTLPTILSHITGIDVGILIGVIDVTSASVAERMSWASRRATTRVEDIAYCLMGLFAVNMPMLYGEGERAFIRLQEEIMKHSDDQSLFAWTYPMAPPDFYFGLLADSPARFVGSGNITPCREIEPRSPFLMGNQGLCIDLRLTHIQNDIYIAALDCITPPDYTRCCAIYLKRFAIGNRQYARVKPGHLHVPRMQGKVKTVYVRQNVSVLGVTSPLSTTLFSTAKRPEPRGGIRAGRCHISTLS